MHQKTIRPCFSTIVAAMLLGVMAGLPRDALAQGWFAGGAIGTAGQDDYEIAGPIATSDDSDTSGRVFGGYLISPIQGVVASFVDLGTTRFAGPAFGGFDDSLEADGIDVSWIVGWAPGEQDRVSVFGTVGVFSWDQDVTLSDSSGTFLYHDEGTSFSAGFGAGINLSRDGSNAWGINVAWQLFKDVGDADNSGQEYDRDTISVGVSYRFGRNN